MITSRSVDDLDPDVRTKAVALQIKVKQEHGIDVLIYCTYRDNEAQDELYSHGRNGDTRPVVTNARGGQSAHNYRRAFDCVPLVLGKPMWDANDPHSGYMIGMVGAAGEALGLEWAGRWTSFRELVHYQDLAGLSIADWAAGKRPSAVPVAMPDPVPDVDPLAQALDSGAL